MATSSLSLASSPGAWKSLFPEDGCFFSASDDVLPQENESGQEEDSWVINSKYLAHALDKQQRSAPIALGEIGMPDVPRHVFPLEIDFPTVVRNYDYPGKVILRTKSTSTCFEDCNDQETTVTSMHSLHHSINVVDKDPKRSRTTEFLLELDIDGAFPVCTQKFTVNPVATRYVRIDFSVLKETQSCLVPALTANIRLAIDSAREQEIRVPRNSTSSLSGGTQKKKGGVSMPRWTSFTNGRRPSTISDAEEN